MSEYNKSEDLIKVAFTVQHGSEVKPHTGLCIAVSGSEVTIITKKKKFETYPKEGQQITKIIPKHTDMSFGFEQGHFHDLTLDSLMTLFDSGKFTAFKMQGSTSFLITEEGIEKKKKVINLSYPNELLIQEIRDSTVVDYITNPSIQSKREEINMYRTIHQEEVQAYERALDQYLSIQTQMQQETDHIKKELLMIEFSKMKRPTPPVSIDQKINRLKRDIRALQQSDAQMYQKALKAAEQAPLTFSGSYERLLISGKAV